MDEDPQSAANRIKEQGNVSFRNKEYPEAIVLYTQACDLLNPENEAHKETLAILHGNIAACYQSQEDYTQALEACDRSLNLNPRYAKARGRKVKILLEMGNLKEAKEETEKGEVPPEIKAEAESRAAAQFEEEKTEMLGKLKDMGNTLLGKFGLSLDNFKAEKNESGSYNISFSK